MKHFEDKWQDQEGITFFLRGWEPDDGKPKALVVLVHGLGGSWRSWQPILNLLAAERRVIAIDLPGHGDTPPLAEPTSTMSTQPFSVTTAHEVFPP